LIPSTTFSHRSKKERAPPGSDLMLFFLLRFFFLHQYAVGDLKFISFPISFFLRFFGESYQGCFPFYYRVLAVHSPPFPPSVRFGYGFLTFFSSSLSFVCEILSAERPIFHGTLSFIFHSLCLLLLSFVMMVTNFAISPRRMLASRYSRKAANVPRPSPSPPPMRLGLYLSRANAHICLPLPCLKHPYPKDQARAALASQREKVFLCRLHHSGPA